MSDFQIFVRVIGRGSNPPGARTQSPNLPWSNWMKCNVFIITYLSLHSSALLTKIGSIITYLSLHSSALLTKIGSVPTIFASEPCRILVFNWIHRAIKYGLFREPPLSIYIREEFDVTEVVFSGSPERTGTTGYFRFFWEFLHSAALVCPFT